MAQNKPVVHFVYNVDATIAAITKDFVHRIVDKDTYPCRLCDVTWGRFFKKPEWTRFVWSLPVKAQFYTRDEFKKKRPDLAEYTAPTIVLEQGSDVIEIINATEFYEINDLDQLKQVLSERLAKYRKK